MHRVGEHRSYDEQMGGWDAMILGHSRRVLKPL